MEGEGTYPLSWFVGSVDRNYVCNGCSRVIRLGFLCTNVCQFSVSCASCFVDCQHCGGRILSKAHERDVPNMIVKCSPTATDNLCRWKGKMIDHAEHLKDCPREFVECPLYKAGKCSDECLKRYHKESIGAHMGECFESVNDVVSELLSLKGNGNGNHAINNSNSTSSTTITTEPSRIENFTLGYDWETDLYAGEVKEGTDIRHGFGTCKFQDHLKRKRKASQKTDWTGYYSGQ